MGKLDKKELKKILSDLPNNVKELFYYVLTNDYHYFGSITSRINDMTQSMYEDTNEKIIKKLTL